MGPSIVDKLKTINTSKFKRIKDSGKYYYSISEVFNALGGVVNTKNSPYCLVSLIDGNYKIRLEYNSKGSVLSNTKVNGTVWHCYDSGFRKEKKLGTVQLISNKSKNSPYINLDDLRGYFERIWCEENEQTQLIEEGQDNETKINSWITGHSIPSGTTYNTVNRPEDWYNYINARKALGDYYSDWFSFEDISKLNSNINSAATFSKTPEGARVNAEGRYWVAVGPGVTGAYTQGMDINTKTLIDNMYGVNRMGRNIDVLIEKISGENKGEQYYLYCVIGDIKEHTGTGTISYNNGKSQQVNGQGIYQTSVSVKTGKSAGADKGDASIVEFIGSALGTNLSNYRLLNILVY
jgi:hypothetical protein